MPHTGRHCPPTILALPPQPTCGQPLRSVGYLSAWSADANRSPRQSVIRGGVGVLDVEAQVLEDGDELQDAVGAPQEGVVAGDAAPRPPQPAPTTTKERWEGR